MNTHQAGYITFLYPWQNGHNGHNNTKNKRGADEELVERAALQLYVNEHSMNV
jgi:hypothetical protein